MKLIIALRRSLDTLYRACTALAGFFLVLTALFVVAQIAGRATGVAIRSSDDFAGYCMAAMIFLALPITLRAGRHVRVSLLLDSVPAAYKGALEGWCLLGAAILIGYFGWSTAEMTWDSYRFNEVSAGLLPTPLWIPQSGITLGLLVFCISLIDELARLLGTGATSYDRTAPVAK